MARALPGLGLIGFWPLGFDGWNTEMDSNLRIISALLQGSVISRVAAEPGSPTDGDRYLLTGTANIDKIAIRDDGAWVYITPKTGHRIFVEAEDDFYFYNDGAWAVEVSNSATGGDYEESVLLATDSSDGNITLSGEYTLQGVALVTGDRVLPTAQTLGENNRVWVVAVGAWTIAEGWDVADTVTAGKIVPVEDGDNAGKKFQLLTTGAIVLGTTALVWDTDTPAAISNFTGMNRPNASYTLAVSWTKTWNYANRVGNQTLTIPTNATAPIVVGSEIIIQHDGSGTKTIAAVSSAVTLNGVAGGSLTLTARGDAYFLKKKNTNTWTAMPLKTSAGATDAMVFKGVIDCSANPNYPAADAGDTYRVSVAGKIGGGSGPNVEVGDLLLCLTDSTSAGTHAAVGANWSITQANVDGAVTGPASAVSGNVASFSGTSGKIIADAGYLAADVLRKNSSANLTVGFTSTGYPAGTKSSGTFTPDPANGAIQIATNGGAHTLAPPSVGSGNSLTMVIKYTNNGSAGAITTSGFTKVDGDAFTTTNGHIFFCYIAVIDGTSHLNVKAMQ